MELSNISDGNDMELTENAKMLIIRLVALDEVQRAEKNSIYNELYELWKGSGLVTKNQFVLNKGFIKKTIIMSMKLGKRKQIDTVQLIYEALTSGRNYTTSDGTLIPCTPEDILYWTQQRRNHHRTLNRRFNDLFEEFEKYITYRNEEDVKPLDYVARPKIAPSRENPSRLAKDKILPGNFTGMTTNDSSGSKRKGKTGNLDQVNRVIVVFYVIKYNL
jgi:hypothetical protein